MEAKPRELLYYQTRDARQPFQEWLFSISLEIRAKIRVKLGKVEDGNLGDMRSVGEGVAELEIDVGPGYRLYIGQEGDKVILLLGGTKKTQDADIKLAKDYWRDYRGRKK